MARSLAELALSLGLQPQPDWDRIEIQGICEDTRRLRAGDLFVAISGCDKNGSEFIAMAVDRGAAAVLSEQSINLAVPVLKVECARKALAEVAAAFFSYPTRDLFTVGVTGTNGKTTTCHWTAELLGSCETRLVSTVRNPSSWSSNLTTPPSPIIQHLARRAADDGAHNLVLEASSAGIAQERVGSIDFDACVFTNLSPEHVQHHHGIDFYRGAKVKLFEHLKPEAYAILNADDSLHPAIAEATAAKILTFGIHAEADIRAVEIRPEARHSRFTVIVRGGDRASVFLPQPGSHNISNALAAIGVGVAHGTPLAVLADRLALVEPIPGRAEFFRRGDGLDAVVDFAHNPSSLEAVLKSLRSEYPRIIVVFGCPGDDEHEKRVAMGRVSGRWADAIVLTSDNPKYEGPAAIADEIRAGIGDSLVPVTVVLEREQAIQAALSQAGVGDIVLLAGKGHETEQLIGDKRLLHSDADVLRRLGFVEGI